MKKYSKVTLFFSIIFILLFIYLGYYFLKKEFHLDATPPPVTEYQKTEEEIQDEKQIQYRLEYTDENDMEQIIHLNRGDALFKFEHNGKSDFKIILNDANGVFIDTLVNEKGEYKGTKMIDVAESGAYILDITADGKWIISYM
jgi:hypothetical protein